MTEKGTLTLLSELPLDAQNMFPRDAELEKAAQFVGVRWLKTVPVEEAIREKGFFGNQNTVCKPRTPRWQHTVDRLKQRFGIDE